MSDTGSLNFDTPLINALDSFLLKEPAYFCIPGHRFQRGVPEELTLRYGEYVFSYDLTEADGLDDLNSPSGALKKSMENAAALFGADECRFLVNGTSSGVEAMITAVCGPGEKLIIARNVHRSALYGIIACGAVPVWVMPQIDEQRGIAEDVTVKSVETAIKNNPDAKAVFITSPTYYGKTSDIAGIATLCHEHDMPLLVDAAHGAHFGFSDDLPQDAVSAGADLCAVSTHKTLFSMTQSSLLFYREERREYTETDEETGEEKTLVRKIPHIDIERVDAALKLFTSSSPSYVLMSSLEACVAKAARDGNDFVTNGIWLAKKLRKGLMEIPGVDVYGGADRFSLNASGIDACRVSFSLYSLGFSGYEVKKRLFEEAQISLEMADARNAVAVVTGVNTEKEILQLIMAVIKLSGETPQDPCAPGNTAGAYIGRTAMTPREAFFAKKKKIRLAESKGQTAAETVLAYPPGIPVLIPGEVIDDLIIKALKGIKDEICIVER